VTNNKVISIFPQWGYFPTNSQQSLAAKVLIGSKKVTGCIKNWPDLEIWVWGRSKSLKMARFDRPCMTLY